MRALTWLLFWSQIEAAGLRKEKGNKAYKEGRLERAVKQYTSAVEFCTSIQDKDLDSEQASLKATVKDIKKSCWLNLAAADLKLERYADVRKNCDKVMILVHAAAYKLQAATGQQLA